MEDIRTKPTEKQLMYGGTDYKKLENYMKKNIPFDVILYFKLLEEKHRYNYYIQAEKICVFFGFKTVFEYTTLGQKLWDF